MSNSTKQQIATALCVPTAVLQITLKMIEPHFDLYEQRTRAGLAASSYLIYIVPLAV